MRIKCVPIILCLGLLDIKMFGHEVIVHEAITVNAAEIAYISSPAYAGFINMVSPDIALKDATNQMRIGSGEEDDMALPRIGGQRVNA
jgi:hypothetical protein